MPLYIGPHGNEEDRPSTQQLLEKYCQPSTPEDVALEAFLYVLERDCPEVYAILEGTRNNIQTTLMPFIRFLPLCILNAFISEKQRIEETLRIESEIRAKIKRMVAPLLVSMQNFFRSVHGTGTTLTDSLTQQNVHFTPNLSSLHSFFDSLHYVMELSMTRIIADLFQRRPEIVDEYAELERAEADRIRMYGEQYLDFNEQHEKMCASLGIPADRVNRNLYGMRALLKASYLTPIRWYLRIFESAIRSQRRQRQADIAPEQLRRILQAEHQHVDLYTQLSMTQFRSMEDQLMDHSQAHNIPSYIWMSYDKGTREPVSMELHEKLFIDRGYVLSPPAVECPGRGRYLAEMQAMIGRVLDECIIPHLAQLNSLALQEEIAGA